MITINSSSVFLVTGGAKGITAQCVIKMAQRHQCKFILLGRSQLNGPEPSWAHGITNDAALKKAIMGQLLAQGKKPTPKGVQKLSRQIQSQREIEGTLTEIIQAGGQAQYLSADITDSQNLQQQLPALTQQLGPITGVIHGAGALADKLIEKKTEQDFELVYTTKISGLETLLRAIPPSQLTHLILFSSVAGFYGNVGQADYAIANETLNKSAYLLKQQYPNCHVVSIDWGPWDGGMVSNEIRKAFKDRDIEIIPVPVGVSMLVNELSAPDQAMQILVGGGALGVDTVLGDTLRTYQIRRRLLEASNPFLRDHYVGKHAVLPIAFSTVWMANSAEQLYPGYYCVEFNHKRVLKGIVFDETLADEYILDLKELSKSVEDGIIFEAKIWSQDPAGRPRYHYSTTLKLVHQQVRKSLQEEHLNNVQALASVISGAEIYRTKRLFHGPLFQGIEDVIELSQEKISLRCRLPQVTEMEQGQFPVQNVNPYLTDVMLQSMIVWVGEFQKSGSLPLGGQQGQYYKNLLFNEEFYITMTIKHVTDLKLTSDIVAYNAQGEVYARFNGATVTISKRLNQLTGMQV